MKSLWTIVTIMATANMLAVGGFLGWLGLTDRMSAERFREIKAIIAPTVEQAAAADAEAEAMAAEEAAAADEEARRANPPLSPAAVLASRTVSTDAASQQIERVKQEARERQAEVQAEAEALARSRQQFEADKAAWEAERNRQVAALGDAQFRKQVELFAALKPKDAKALVLEMDQRGDREEVVRLLDAMETRIKAKVIAEMTKTAEDRTLASELLARLQDLGRPSPGTEAPVEPLSDVDPLEPTDG